MRPSERLLKLAVSCLQEGDLPSARRVAGQAALAEVDEQTTDQHLFQVAQRLNRALAEVITVVIVVEHERDTGRQLRLFSQPATGPTKEGAW